MKTPPAGWLREVQTYLDLADGGVVVLVDHADDARLSELGRHLLRDRPELRVVLRASELSELPDRGCALLYLQEDELVPLNLARQILRDRSLKVVVWSPEELTRKMARRAPDLYDWISHRVLCPPDGVSTVARAGLLSARSTGLPVEWRGGARSLRRAVRELWPDLRVHQVSAAGLLYGQLVRELRAHDGAFVILDGGGGGRARWSWQWALAETRVAWWGAVGGAGGGGVHVDKNPKYRFTFKRLGLRRRQRALVDDDFVFDVASRLTWEGLSAGQRAQLTAVVRGERPAEPVWRVWQEFGARYRARARARLREEWEHPDHRWEALALLERARLLEDPPAAPIPPAVWAQCQLWRDGDRPWAELAEIAASLGHHDAAVHWEGYAGRDAGVYARRVQASMVGRPVGAQLRVLRAATELAPEWAESLEALALSLGGDVGGWAGLRPAAAAYIASVGGDWRGARESVRAAVSGPTLGVLEQQGVAFAAWCCGEREGLTRALHSSELEAWRIALGLEEPASPADPARQFARLIAAAQETGPANRELIGGHFAQHEHYLEGVSSLFRGRALARMGQAARAQDHLQLAASIVRRATKNLDHPWALMADFERAWLRTVHGGAGRAVTEDALGALAAALWPGHPEVLAAGELLARI